MIKNYLKLAFKSIISQGHQSVISAIGLAVALSCAILILLYVQYEFSYDSYHKRADKIYRIVAKRSGSKYMGKSGFVVTAGPLKEALVNEIPEIKYSTKCTMRSHILECNSSLFNEYGFLYTDTDFLKIFTFPVISGNPAQALKEPFALFLTRDMAAKYFGNEDPIGKTLRADNKYVFTIRGILENVPQNSHFHFDFLTGFETLYSIRGGKNKVEKWGTNTFLTYIELMDNVQPEDIEIKLNELYFKYINKEKRPGSDRLIPEPLKTIHFSGNANFELGNNNDFRYIFLISSIGIFILLIACFNYMNMATARSYERGREIGILKVAGGSRPDLIIQFLTESVIISFVGLIIALVIVWFLLPFFSEFTDRPLTFRMLFENKTFIEIITLTVFAGVFAGVYPALKLSSFSPLHLIKNDFRNILGKKQSGNLKNILVVIQYMISIVALICTMTVFKQLTYIKNADPGFAVDDILNVYLRDPSIRRNPEPLITALYKNLNIVDVTYSTNLPTTIMSNWSADWEGKTKDQNMNVFRGGIGNNFFDFYKLEIISGRGFSNEFTGDTLNAIIINQKTAKVLGWEDPIGKRLSFNNNTEHTIVVGVFKDFYFHSLHTDIEPLSFSPVGSNTFPVTQYLSVKVRHGSASDVRLFVEKTLKDFSPGYLNSVSIFRNQVDDRYNTDRKLGVIFIFSTILAVILTCLGQYSLSSYTTKSRMKEMVIRKVMGSHPSGIMGKLILEMSAWIMVSIVIAFPVAYILMNKWLQNFAFHVDIGAGVFLLSLFITLLISVIAISYHIVKLSRVNPAEMIRHE